MLMPFMQTAPVHSAFLEIVGSSPCFPFAAFSVSALSSAASDEGHGEVEKEEGSSRLTSE